ncbi:MAG: hypothetical protein M1831_003396 [Alyxoria varia]|nr:MAG: hypothetical protein M1831_003396 [Alyxoria varia]
MAPALRTRKLGRDGPEVTQLGLGLMGMSMAYGKPLPDADRYAFLDAAYEAGELHWDSADIYGDNEEFIGEWFRRNPEARKNIFFATKFGNRKDPSGNFYVDSNPEYCKQACETSLQRLGLPSVDLYYCHRLDGKTPIEHTVRAMAELKQAGKFKYLGLSECSSASLRRAHAVHPITAVQIEYSPFSLDIESPQIDLLRTCRELGVATVAYSPIGRGMLGGHIRSPDDFEDGDFRKYAPRFSAENFPKNLQLVDVVNGIAGRKGVTASQLTLAWLMAQGDDVFPIPGTTKKDRLVENLDSLEIRLSKDEEAEIRKACEEAEVVGDRYPGAMNSVCFMDTPPL